MRRCSKCNLDKNLNEFNKHKSRPDGLSSWCKECVSKKSKQNYLENFEKFKSRRTKDRKIRRDWFREIKSKYNCIKCGEYDIACLDFHHIDPKTKLFQLGGSSKSMFTEEQILNEIKKCEVLCANCHRKLHFKY